MNKNKIIIILLISVLFVGSAIGTFLLLSGDKKSDEPILTERFDGADYGIDLFSRLDRLAETNHNYIVEQQSSYSRDGGNADGFGTTNHAGPNITGEPDGRGNPLIRKLLTLDQPGVVYRMWFTHFGAVPNLRIYVDGELLVDENLVTLTSGSFHPFIKPLVQNQAESSGGFVFYVPIVFKESIEIIGSGNFYYNINYTKLPADLELESFNLDMDLGNAVEILQNVGTDPKYRGDYTKKQMTTNLASNVETKVFEYNGRQTVSSLNLRLPNIETITYDRTLITDEGVRLNNLDAILFDIDVKDTGTQLLRFRTVIEGFDQRFSVMVEGRDIGVVRVRPRRLEGFEWKDNPYWFDVEIEVPNSLINGKDNVEVRLQGLNRVDIYSIWSVNNGDIVDELVMSSSKSRDNHNLKNAKGFVPQTLEYDPNMLISDSKWEGIFNDEDFINNVWIKIYYDGNKNPAVEAPISSFFGFGEFGAFETISLMTGLKSDGTMYSYYPMPFEASIEITLTNKNDNGIDDVSFITQHEENIHEKDSYGYFKTNYVRYEAKTDSALQNGSPMTFLKTGGAGHIVGVTHSMTGDYMGEHSRFYLEGDEQIYIDGSLSHSYHGTGTEDFYNGAWYFNNGVQTTPLYGVSAHNYRGIDPDKYTENINRTVMLRTLVTDPINFRDGIDFKMEHGGSNDRIDSNAYILTYYYHQDTPALNKTDEFYFVDDTHLEHNYVQDGNSTFETINGRFEGLYRHINTDKTVAANIIDYAEFTIKINPNNEGVILSWLLDLSVIDQTGILYVNDKLVSTFNNPFRAANANYVRSTDLFIPKVYTDGLSEITIRLENNANNKSSTPLTALGFEVKSLN